MPRRSIWVECPRCAGTGKVTRYDACPVCHGHGNVRKDEVEEEEEEE